MAGPVVAMWLECEQELMDYRNMVRDEGEMAMVVPRSRRGASAKSSLRRAPQAIIAKFSPRR